MKIEITLTEQQQKFLEYVSYWHGSISLEATIMTIYNSGIWTTTKHMITTDAQSVLEKHQGHRIILENQVHITEM